LPTNDEPVETYTSVENIIKGQLFEQKTKIINHEKLFEDIY
jgi:hypothetical protein